MSARALVHGSGAVGATYACGQLLNLVSQVIVLDRLGPGAFAGIGLAQVGVLTAVFLGDLGYGTLFLREIRQRADWQGDWASAQRHRLLCLSAAAVGMAAFWGARYGADAPGTRFLLGALPGVLLSVFNFGSPLMALGRPALAGLGLPVLWGTYCCCVQVVLHVVPAGRCPFWLGVGLSVAFGAQALMYVASGRRYGLTRLRPGVRRAGLLAAAFPLWYVALLGTLYERVTPFLVEWARPELLPYYLLASQALQGLTGLLSQVQRVLVPVFADLRAERRWETAAPRIVWGIGAGVAALYMLVTSAGVAAVWVAEPAGWRGAMPYLMLVGVAWVVTSTGGTLVPGVIAAREERFLARAMTLSHTSGLLVQSLAVLLADLRVLFVAKAALAAAVLVACLARLGLRVHGLALLSLGALGVPAALTVVGVPDPYVLGVSAAAGAAFLALSTRAARGAELGA